MTSIPRRFASARTSSITGSAPWAPVPTMSRLPPQGISSQAESGVWPNLIAAGAQAVIDFLKKAFGARERRRYDMPDGSIMHAEVRIGDTVVMIGDAGEDWPAVPAHLHVYVDSVDETYRRGLDAGGVSVQPPQQKGQDPDRRAA